MRGRGVDLIQAGEATVNAEAMRAPATISRRLSDRSSVCVPALISLFFLSFGSAQAAPPVRFAGAVGGLVTDSTGIPQAGAMVSLFNQQAKLLQKSYTDLSGNFSFGDLIPDLYSVQVTMATFVPASREHVQVHPGMRSLLEVNLSKLFSSIQVVSSKPIPGSLMSDDWKWTLRADSALRPVLRILPSELGKASGGWAAETPKTAAFHDSSAIVRVSATDTALTDASADEADLGTQFAFATSLYSNSQVHVAGDVGYAPTGQPEAAFRTTFSHQMAGDTPSVSVTLRQMNIPTRIGQGLMGGPNGNEDLPALRTLSVSMKDTKQLSENLAISYGSELDTITFVSRLQYFSPWAKVAYALPHGRVDMIFTSGNSQPGLDARDSSDPLQNELAAVSRVPRLSEWGGNIKVQRGDDYEIGYSDVVGGTEFRVSGYHQYVSNSTLTIANPDGAMFTGDLLPSMFASSAFFDAGTVTDSGYTVSASRTMGRHKLTVAYGTLGVMTPDGMPIADAASLRQAISAANRNAVTIRSAGVFERTGTRYVASYEYANLNDAVAMASFSTQPERVEPGLNIAIRQPIPFFTTSLGHVEATADMRNLLAQGYLPLAMTDGRQILIVNNPRVLRGGLAFIF